MVKVFLIHGYRAEPNGGWRPYILRELSKKNIYACALSMPNPENPSLLEWLREIHRHVKRNSADTIILVGHSLGCAAILKYLEMYRKSVHGVILVSPRMAGGGSKNTVVSLAEFYEKSFNFDRLRKLTSLYTIFHGDTDTIIPSAHGEFIAQKLGAEFFLIKNGGHLGGSDGFYEFEALKDEILVMCK